jgi:hypothetical protein
MTTNSKVVSKKVRMYGVIVVAAAIIILTATVTSEVSINGYGEDDDADG